MPSNYTIIRECEDLADSLSLSLEEKRLKKTRTLVMKRTESEKIIKKLRESYKKHLKDIGKNQTIGVDKIFELHQRKKIPDMIKHCVVAVLPKIKGGKSESFIGAHNLCYWSFRRHKLVNENFLMTSRGRVREDYHTGGDDPNKGKKNAQYNKLFRKVFGKAK